MQISVNRFRLSSRRSYSVYSKEHEVNERTVIYLDHVSRRFGRTLAVDDLNLNVVQGDLFGVIGPDGSGKTTLLRLIAAVLDPTGQDDLGLRERVTERL